MFFLTRTRQFILDKNTLKVKNDRKLKNSNTSRFEPKFTLQHPLNMFDFSTKYHMKMSTFS